MAEIAPFRALRYDDKELARVVAPPYDVIDAELRKSLGARSPNNIVHIDLPEGEGDAKYAHAAALLAEWSAAGVLKRDAQPRLLRYEQEFAPPDGGPRVTQRGFFTLVRAEPYEKKVVLPHERTLSGPKEDRYKLFCATRAALSPVFLLYPDPSGATKDVLACAQPTVAFETPDGIAHRLAEIADPAAITRVVRALSDRQLLIADGHHRYETMLRYAASEDARCAAAGRPAHPRGAHRYVLAFLADVDDPGLVVFPTHRLVHGLKGFTLAHLLERASATFRVTEAHASDLVRELADAGRTGPSFAAMEPSGRAWLLTLRPDIDPARHGALGKRPTVLRTADVVVLHAALLEELMGITPEMQAQYQHLKYYKSAGDAVGHIRAGEGNVLFLMNPTPVATVRRACEAGEVMPQKATFFYPKVLTGLVIQPIDPYEAVAG